MEARAVSKLAERADEILLGPRATIGPPWTKDHRMALAATIVAGEDEHRALSPSTQRTDVYVAGSLDESEVRPTVQELTGRAPRTFEQWATAHADAFR